MAKKRKMVQIVSPDSGQVVEAAADPKESSFVEEAKETLLPTATRVKLAEERKRKGY